MASRVPVHAKTTGTRSASAAAQNAVVSSSRPKSRTTASTVLCFRSSSAGGRDVGDAYLRFACQQPVAQAIAASAVAVNDHDACVFHHGYLAARCGRASAWSRREARSPNPVGIRRNSKNCLPRRRVSLSVRCSHNGNSNRCAAKLGIKPNIFSARSGVSFIP